MVIINKIGFIGLGIMGKPMTINLLKSGYEVIVNDINQESIDETVKHGATYGEYSEIAEKASIILICLPNGQIIKSVLEDEDFLHSLKAGTIVINTSSVNPDEAEEFSDLLKEVNVKYLDSPISGGEVGAIAGSLTIMAGGDREVFEEVKPILNILGEHITLIGEIGSGSAAKLVNNIIANLYVIAFSEAFVFCKKAGLDPGIVYNAIKDGFAGSNIMDVKLPAILERDFSPIASIAINQKDIRNALKTAEKYEVELPFTKKMYEVQKSLEDRGLLNEDHAAYVKYFEELSGVIVE